MNSKFLLTGLLALALLFGAPTMMQAGKNADLRVAYVLKKIGVNKEIQAKLRPLLQSYLADKKVANKEYDDLKEKLQANISNGSLTEKQAQTLLTLKWSSDEKELAVKKTYEKKFRTVLSAKKTYLCFTLLNDKKSKIKGQ
ncbi:MAG: hypothetical protein J6Y04_10205 [Bacteroidaceae bacterium]|nr:hypothetical protein [Bacteroidaceae bacterium]